MMIERLRRNAQLAALIVVAVVLAVVNVYLYNGSQTAGDEEAQLEISRAAAAANLATAKAQYDVVKLQAEYDSLSRAPEFPSAYPVVDLTGFLAEGGPLLHVSIVEVGPVASAGSETIGGKAYPAYQTRVKASGTLPNLTGFLTYLEGGYLSSLKIRDVAFTGAYSDWTASFTVVLISQK